MHLLPTSLSGAAMRRLLACERRVSVCVCVCERERERERDRERERSSEGMEGYREEERILTWASI